MDKLRSISKNSKLPKISIIIFLALVLGLGFAYIGLRIWFKQEIDEICYNAQRQYAGDKIEALISVLNSRTQSLNDKNRAIWALGKLRDKRALPILKNLKTVTECDHSRFVCQREIAKAIGNLEGTSIDILTFK